MAGWDDDSLGKREDGGQQTVRDRVMVGVRLIVLPVVTGKLHLM